MTSESVIRAAGGVVWRNSGLGGIEVVVVHRPAYDDWTLPKGKRRRGEKGLACALREVEEETGLICTPGAELPRASYMLADGTKKVVRWWPMSVVEDTGFVPGDEVDEIRWVPASTIESIVTYPLDATVVDSFLHSTG
ncbi:MAG TPA: NUDIX hydrolase [Microthrixaceae bacterium]|nr:NUDIX hydrolase [Microthrixaceae bacterium]